MRRLRLIWVLRIVVVLTATGAAVPAGAAARRAYGLGPLRAWGGTVIRSLDPPVATASGATGLQAGQSPLQGASSSPSPSSGSRSSPSSGSPRVPPDQILSNETTFTRWAYVAQIAPIYQRPATRSPRVVSLHWFTEDGFPETYLLLRAHWDAAGQEWVKLRIPMRPNGLTGWVRRQDLGAFHLTHIELTVNRARLRMSLYESGRLVWSAPVAVGKPSTPTPAGHFWIRERFKIEDPSSGYWPYAFGTSDYSTLTDWPDGGVVGIHGPYFQPQDIPGQISHGCIRLGDADDAWLAGHIGLGTPLAVQ